MPSSTVSLLDVAAVAAVLMGDSPLLCPTARSWANRWSACVLVPFIASTSCSAMHSVLQVVVIKQVPIVGAGTD